MTETVLLYALSTLAQTCAALAAFVGAVGVFRLQLLRDQRREAERELRRRSEGLTNRDFMVISLKEIFAGMEDPALQHHPNLPGAREARHRWEAFGPHLQHARSALVIFEVWNLLVIGAALIGFNFIASLTAVGWVSWLFGIASVGTVIVTLVCVVIWTRQANGGQIATTSGERSTDALTGRLARLDRWTRRLKWASIATLVGLAVSFLGAQRTQMWLRSLVGGAGEETSGFSESLGRTVIRGPQSQQWITFVFVVSVTFFWGLIGEIPDQSPLRHLPGRLGVWGARWSGRSLRLTLRLVIFFLLVYSVLISPTGRNWLVGLLNVWKPERHF